MHGTWSVRRMAALPHHPQLHNRTGIPVLRYWQTAGVYIMQIMQGRAEKQYRVLVTIHVEVRQVLKFGVNG